MTMQEFIKTIPERMWTMHISEIGFSQRTEKKLCELDIMTAGELLEQFAWSAHWAYVSDILGIKKTRSNLDRYYKPTLKGAYKLVGNGVGPKMRGEIHTKAAPLVQEWVSCIND